MREGLEGRLAAAQMEANELRQQNARLRAEQGAAAAVEGSQDSAIRWMQNELDRERRAHAQQLEALARELQEQRQQLAVAVSRRMAVGGRISLGAASTDSRGPDLYAGAMTHVPSLGAASWVYSSLPPSPVLDSRPLPAVGSSLAVLAPPVTPCLQLQSSHGTPSSQFRAVTPTPQTPLGATPLGVSPSDPSLQGAVARSQSVPALKPTTPLYPLPQSRSRSRSSTPARSPRPGQRALPARRCEGNLCQQPEASQQQLPLTWSHMRVEPIAANVPLVAAERGPLRSVSAGSHAGSMLGCGELHRTIPPVCVMQNRTGVMENCRTTIVVPTATVVTALPSQTWVAPTASPMRPALQVARGAKRCPPPAWRRAPSPPPAVNLTAAFQAAAP